MNAISVLFPYKYEGMWVFDDPAAGLVREPFVCGIDEMIESTVAAITNAEKGFRLLSFADAISRLYVEAEWRREEYGGKSGITAQRWARKDGCARLSLSIL